MAVDEYLFTKLTGEPGTYLRFYTWKHPTASVGYSQNVNRVADIEFCRKNGVDVVRRLTGGKLVLHHREITYSLCSSDTDTFSKTVGESYRLISLGLMKGLERMGLNPVLADAPPQDYSRGILPCFAHPARNEVEVAGKKIIGSAQKRVGERFLQQGSIPVENDETLLQSVSALPPAENVLRIVSLTEALGRTVSFDWAVNYFVEGLSEFFQVSFQKLGFSAEEMEKIKGIEAARYANPDWTFRNGDDTILMTNKAEENE
jgi:lipoate-protein ligase A